MEKIITKCKLEHCSEELKRQIEETRKRLNDIYINDVSYEEKMKVSEEMDALITLAASIEAKPILEK